MGSYYTYHVVSVPKAQLTTLGKIAAGGWNWAAKERDGIWVSRKGPEAASILFGILWPSGIIIAGGSWIAYAIYWALWFMIWGGGGRLLGLVS